MFSSERPGGVPLNDDDLRRERAARASRDIFVEADSETICSRWKPDRRLTGHALTALRNLMSHRRWLKSTDAAPGCRGGEMETWEVAAIRLAEGIRILMGSTTSPDGKRWFPTRDMGRDKQWRFSPPDAGRWALILPEPPSEFLWDSRGFRVDESSYMILRRHADDGTRSVRAWLSLQNLNHHAETILGIEITIGTVASESFGPHPDDWLEIGAEHYGAAPTKLPETPIRVEARDAVEGWWEARLPAAQEPKPPAPVLVLSHVDGHRSTHPIRVT